MIFYFFCMLKLKFLFKSPKMKHYLIIFFFIPVVINLLCNVNKRNNIKNQFHNDRQDGVNKKQQKLFPIEKPNTTPEPRTMMIHPQNTLFTSRAMVTSPGFEAVANHAISFFPCFWLVHVESLLLSNQIFHFWISDLGVILFYLKEIRLIVKLLRLPSPL